MKKFMKTCGIIALVMIVLGVALGIAGSSVAGRATISQVVETVTGGRVKVEFGDGGWGIFSGIASIGDMEVDLGSGPNVNYDIGDASMFSKEHDIMSGDVEPYSPGSGIRNLKMQVGGCDVETKASKDDRIYVEAKGMRKFQGYVEGDTLYVLGTVKSGLIGLDRKSEVILYLPEDYFFDEVEIDMGAGALDIDRLSAGEVSLEVGAGRITLGTVQVRELTANVGAGQIELKDMVVGELDVEVGMGEFTAQGSLDGDAEVECSMGNVEMKLDGREEDFNYQIEGAMGSIRLDKEDMGGFAQEKSIDNGAAKTMKIECSMGNVTVKFRD